MLRSFTKKRGIAALAIVAVLALAGGALAYFSGGGNGTGSASVGKSAGFSVTVGSDSSGSLLPGSGSEALGYTITNKSSGVQNLAATHVAVVSNTAGDITQGGADVPGCLASWFTATDAPPTYGEIQGGQAVTGTVTVTMQDANVSQDPCQNATPDISVTAS